MLILSRREGQSVKIGDHVWLHVLKITSGRVTLGFVADPGVRIWRHEAVSEYPIEKEDPAGPGPPPDDEPRPP